MRNIREVADQELAWIQPPMFKMDYELRAGDDVVATLRWKSEMGTFATAETADGQYTYKRVGFLNPRVTIRSTSAESAGDLATFKPNLSYTGTLTFPDGSSFAWSNTNFWYTEWSWKTADGEQLIAFKPKGELKRITRTEGYMTISPSAAGLEQLSLLATLGWYLILLTQHDAAGALVY